MFSPRCIVASRPTPRTLGQHTTWRCGYNDGPDDVTRNRGKMPMSDEESTPWWLVDGGTPPPPPPPPDPWITRDPTGQPVSGAYDPPSTPLAPPAPKSATPARRRGTRQEDLFPPPPPDFPPDFPPSTPQPQGAAQPVRRRVSSRRRNT